jgi:hypothetical protein
MEVIGADERGPWDSRSPLEAMCDLIGFLRCHIRPERQEGCAAKLTEMVQKQRFLSLSDVNDEDRTLFQQAVAATMNASGGTETSFDNMVLLSHEQWMRLCTRIVPDGVKLPFCVTQQGKRRSWFVPVDESETKFKSCLWLDRKLAEHFFGSLAVYSDAWVPFMDPRLHAGVLPDLHAKVDMIVWFVWFILNRSGRAVHSLSDENKLMLSQSDFNDLLNRLVAMVQDMSNRYAFLRGPGGLPPGMTFPATFPYH